MLDTAAGGWYHISGAGIRQAEKNGTERVNNGIQKLTAECGRNKNFIRKK